MITMFTHDHRANAEQSFTQCLRKITNLQRMFIFYRSQTVRVDTFCSHDCSSSKRTVYLGQDRLFLSRAFISGGTANINKF